MCDLVNVVEKLLVLTQKSTRYTLCVKEDGDDFLLINHICSGWKTSLQIYLFNHVYLSDKLLRNLWPLNTANKEHTKIEPNVSLPRWPT